MVLHLISSVGFQTG